MGRADGGRGLSSRAGSGPDVAAALRNGVDLEHLGPWLADRIDGWSLPNRVELIEGGRSNLTFRIVDPSGTVVVLRRPPLGHVLPTAHDVLREARIIGALGPTPVPVPPVLATCDDVTVTGAPFYVMAFVPGRVIESSEQATDLPVATRRRAAFSVVDALAALHAVEPDDVGLGQLGKREDYCARQLKRWSTQFAQSKTREIPAVERVHDVLVASIPRQQRSSIVHGDYRMGNCIMGDDGEVQAILDWELCTLGDPLADLGYVVATWGDTDLAGPREPDGDDAGTATSAELVARYGDVSGLDVADVDFYTALALWRRACIVEGVYSRARAGAQGDKDIDLDALALRAPKVAGLAEEAAARWHG